MPPVDQVQPRLLDDAPADFDDFMSSGRQCANCHGWLEAAEGHYHSRRPNDGAGPGRVELVCCNCAVNVFMAYCRIAAEARL